MADFGLTDTGFIPKTLENLKGEFEEDFRSNFGAAVNVEPESVNGQLIGIFSERLAELWEGLLDVYASMDPDQATGTAQDALMALTGTMRLGARNSTATVYAVGDAGTSLLAGRIFSIPGLGTRFDSLATVALVAAPAWTGSHAYALGDVVANAGRVFYATAAGTSAASGGPSGSGTAIVDGTVTWRSLGAGAAYAAVPVRAEATGPKPAYAWTLTTVETAVAGLNAVTNPLDAVLGSDVETWAAARVRRELELQSSGLAAADAIRASVLTALEAAAVDAPAVAVFLNDGDTTDVDGHPPHSVEVVVRGGTDVLVRASVFASVAGGIQAVGTNTGTVVDAEGGSHAVAFSRPTEKPVYLDLVVATDSNFPADGINLIKQTLADWGNANLNMGDDVIQSRLYAPVFTISGVTDVTTLAVGLTAWPTLEDNLAMGLRELAEFDTSRVRVNGV